MAWYYWVLIVLGVVALGTLKWWVAKQIRAKRKQTDASKKKNEED